MNIRDRVKELRIVSTEDIVPNPKNWRVHPESQRTAMAGVLEEVGFAAAAVARELPDGRVMLIDGHLRNELAAGGKLPVLILDVTEEEADRLLLTLDPIKEMADADSVAMQALFDTISTESEAVAKLLESTAGRWALFNEDDDATTAESLGMPHADADDSEDADDTYDTDAGEGVLAGVRMVQLFLNETNVAEFHEACLVLGDKYGTENLTDTVLEAMRSAVNSL